MLIIPVETKINIATAKIVCLLFLMVSALIALVNGLSRWICRVDHESAVAVLVSYGLAVIQGRIIRFDVLHLLGHILGFLEHSGTSTI